ncbi:MAG: hypothetical protein Q4G26_08530 [Paracoccus sp. (in: a-proteobacteria)]|nr:hypothetical protein [Paracoccus sp. (in: a-proteobacteria)]
MTPEAKILILNAVIMAIGYPGIHGARHITHISQMALTDLVLTALALMVAGALFTGTGTRFSLIFLQVNWLAFSLVTLILIEIPFFIWFCRRHGLDMTGGRR